MPKPAPLTDKQYVELLLERDRHRAILSSLSEGVISTDPNGLVTYMNPSAETLLGLSDNACKGKRIEQVFTLIDETTQQATPIARQDGTKEHPNPTHHYVLKRHDKTHIYISWGSTTIIDENNASLGEVITFKDISDTHQLTLQLKHQTTHDNLTGLVNHDEFKKRLNSLLSTSYGSNAVHSLIHIDLDQFTTVNQHCGYQAGDSLLKQISALMKPKVRGRDTLARIGSDKFAVLLENCPKKVALKIAEELLNIIREFRFLWRDKSFDIGASFGIAYFTSNPLDDGDDPLNMANRACLKAKENGRNQIVECDTSHLQHTTEAQHAEMHWVGRIKSALKENRLLLFQQTIAPIKQKNSLFHFEILLRMQSKNGDIISPSAFLSVAERYNMINKIDRWVIENTFKWLSNHPSVLNNTHLCSINLSALSLSDETLARFVNNCFSKYSIACQKICFEVTETSAIHNLDSAIRFMKQMQQLGCSFSLDDFGTGMSSFSYLKHLPVNHLKIDGSFIRNITNDPIDLAMTRSINEIGHVMGMSTIAEFVENEDILQQLQQLNVDYAQGYHIAKPEPLDTLINKL
ncbi:MAG: GGDEF domain-containing protein [Piscirickettsiaceae bacterium]|nr:MAG: GGDEF domain-containing protein [Piscirickettsiaceae bacterium]